MFLAANGKTGKSEYMIEVPNVTNGDGCGREGDRHFGPG